MTRKDYVLLAEALKEARNHCWAVEVPDPASFRVGLQAAAEEIAGALGRDNPKFDRDRFLKASGVQS